MALVLAGVRLPDPHGGLVAARNGLDLARPGVRWAHETAVFAVGLAGRINALLDDADALLYDVSALMDRINSVVDSTELVVAGAEATNRAAEGVVLSASLTSKTALELVELLEPITRQSIPFARKFVESLQDSEVDAAIDMVDHLPALVKHMEATMPILATLGTVAPEVHELLGVTKDVRRAVIGIPGFKFFRNRGQDKLDEEGFD